MQTAFKLARARRIGMRSVFQSLLIVAIAGCSTTPPATISPAEQMYRDQSLGLSVANQLEQKLRFKTEPQVTEYLESLSRDLMSNLPLLKESSVMVQMVKRSDSRWVNYSVPGTRIYLAVGLLSSIKFENELAAAIALELGHLTRRNLAQRYEKMTGGIDLLGREGAFDYSEQELISALEPGIHALFDAGFDARGMVALLSHYQESPEISPYGPQLLSKLLENSRRIIALHAPLRNPIVRSDRFLALQKRMQRL